MSDVAAAIETGRRHIPPPKKRRPRSIAEMDRRTLEKLDRRSVEFKRYEDIRAALVSDRGGEAAVSTAEAQIADKAAFIAMTLEGMQIASLAGEDIDLQRYGELTDRLRRNLESIGLERKAKDVTPLSEYLRAKRNAGAIPSASATAGAAQAATVSTGSIVAPGGAGLCIDGADA
jgi:hypothetical protein